MFRPVHLLKRRCKSAQLSIVPEAMAVTIDVTNSKGFIRRRRDKTPFLILSFRLMRPPKTLKIINILNVLRMLLLRSFYIYQFMLYIHHIYNGLLTLLVLFRRLNFVNILDYRSLRKIL